MTTPAAKLAEWLDRHQVTAEVLRFDESVHTVDDAVRVSGVSIEHITKSILLVSDDDRLFLAVVPANRRASTDRVRKALGLESRPRPATAAESLERAGQALGGNTPLNASALTILIDPAVLELEWVIIGGGDDRHLVRISVKELVRVVEYQAVRIRK